MNHETSTATKIVMALLLAGVLAWAADISSTVNSVTRLEPQIESIQQQQQRNTQWISDWPQNGQLAGDVAQNERILALAETTADLVEADRALEAKIDEILWQITELRIDQAKQNGEPR